MKLKKQKQKETKLVILAGGRGTRLAELTGVMPKPMIKIGSKPIIWHIMKIYSSYGIKNFIICTGYKGGLLKKVLSKYQKIEKWKINFVFTGHNTLTGGRIKRIESLVKNQEYFFLSYGDGLSDININNLLKFHLKNKKSATLTAVKYKNPKGIVFMNNKSEVSLIKEKPIEFINGGFFVLTNKIFKYLKDDMSIFEIDCLAKLAKKNELLAFKHKGFWACMDTMRDKIDINQIWSKKKAPWKIW